MTRRMHSMPFGAEIGPDGVRFSLWAPTAREVALVLDETERPMPEVGEGWRQLVAPEACAGSRYGFRIDGDLVVPDPASRFQPDDVHGRSAVVDPGAYAWSDDGWTGRPWVETILYEVHVGTATPEGTYAALADKLEDLRDLGITAVELMPLAEFPGRRNWGYDGVMPFAPDAAYGPPEDLKRLIERAHALGLMVFLDVVYNHFGPSGNYLGAYAEAFFTERHQTPWGAGINFDGKRGGAVREFYVHNALYWLEEFHMDGLRLDAVHAILDDSEQHIIAEIAERVRAAFPGREIHLVLENGANEARWLTRRDDTDRPRLYTAQWDDDIHHGWHVLLTGEKSGYYEDYAERTVTQLGRSLAEGFAYQGDVSKHEGGVPRGEPSAHLPPSAFVAFLQNHDQIGNRAFGERLSDLAAPERLALARAGLLLAPQIPLLFMGEEWAASAPFLFFADFEAEPDLARAIRDGRRREFARFDAFSDPAAAARIPDPTAEATFRRSRLDWAEPAREPHAGIRAETRRLLDLRAAEIVPLTKSRFLGGRYDLPRDDALAVTWRFAVGTLRFLANFGRDSIDVDLGDGGNPLWTSPGVAIEAGRVCLPAWSGAFLKGDAA